MSSAEALHAKVVWKTTFRNRLAFVFWYMVVKDMGRLSWEFLYNFHWEICQFGSCSVASVVVQPPQKNDRHLYHAVGWVEPHILWR